MADINVERKSGGGRNFLPWILGLLLLAALLWGLSRMFGGEREETNAVPVDSTMTTTETTGDPAATGTVMPADTAGMADPGAAMPMDSGAAGMGGQTTGARDSAGGDTVAEGPTGNP